MTDRLALTKRTTLILNAIVVIFFGGFLVYTFFARQHLDGLAREFCIDRTLLYARPVLDDLAAQIEKRLDQPVVKRVLPEARSAVVRREIESYRNDARGYIADLVRHKPVVEQVVDRHPAMRKASEMAAEAKAKIRDYYDETLRALIADLRLFGASNLVAGLVAFLLAWRSPHGVRRSLVWFSLLMFAAVLYNSYVYVDDLTFFRIFFRLHLGWWYPVGVCATLIGLYHDYGPLGHVILGEDDPEPRQPADEPEKDSSVP